MYFRLIRAQASRVASADGEAALAESLSSNDGLGQKLRERRIKKYKAKEREQKCNKIHLAASSHNDHLNGERVCVLCL